MSFKHSVATCYPKFAHAYRLFEQLSLKQRSLLIKSCQAQTIPTDPSSTLYKLLSEELVIEFQRGDYRTIPLREIFTLIVKSPNEPLQSAIMLDILRGTPAGHQEFIDIKSQGWVKEIDLSHTKRDNSIDFGYFFDPTATTPPHPDLVHNPLAHRQVWNRFRQLRELLIEHRPLHFARYTHKNMSNETRRNFERSSGISLEGVPIWGQDDWIRHYHKTGEQLEGSMEMRQKWYPANAKPRTYFAQGGTAYGSSRFLQDFFTTLVNYFPSTNHITRLQPYRLSVPVENGEQGHYLIYDLSSFTSNMQAQKEFCYALREYFKDVEVDLFDERYGVVTYTMGELLDDYNQHCVDEPLLNQSRVPNDIRDQDEPYPHKRASMLGIYGNLMTCTLAHFLIVSTTCDHPFRENNTAGDDGAALIFLITYALVVRAIYLVGIFAMDKTFNSKEAGVIALKRPLEERTDISGKPVLWTRENIVPPNLMVATCYLYGHEIDPRYTLFYEDTPDHIADRISVVGKDLIRFLDSAHKMNYWDVLLGETYRGFGRLVHNIVGELPKPGGSIDGKEYVWPFDPDDYEFLHYDPYFMYAFVLAQGVQIFDKRDDKPRVRGSLKYSGDETTCNSDKWLKLMVTLGYMERIEVKEVVTGYDVVRRIYAIFRYARLLDPVLYTYRVLCDVPSDLLW